jgi:hypothetical protein
MHHRTVPSERKGRGTHDLIAMVSLAHRGHSRPVGRKRYSKTNGEISIAAHNPVTSTQNIAPTSYRAPVPPTSGHANIVISSLVFRGAQRWFDDLPAAPLH